MSTRNDRGKAMEIFERRRKDYPWPSPLPQILKIRCKIRVIYLDFLTFICYSYIVRFFYIHE